MKKSISMLVCLALCLSLVLLGCSNSSNNEVGKVGEENTNGDSREIVVGFSQCSQDVPYYTLLTETAAETAKELGYKIIVIDAQSDITKQNNDIADLISRGVDAIIINPVEPDGVAPAINQANEQGVHVFTVDRPVNLDVVAHVGRDNITMGQNMGKYAVKLLGGEGKAKGKVLEVIGPAGDNVMLARSSGFREIVEKEPGIKIVQTPYCDYVRSKAVSATMDIVQAQKDFDLIYAHNDEMALGALQVFEENGIQGTKVLGIDGWMEALIEMAKPESGYTALSTDDPVSLGEAIAVVVNKYFKGEDIPSFIDAGSDVIDKNNVAEYLDENRLYANVPFEYEK